ncbi:hypothetical protein [Rhodoblastus sp.]|uniref:hypothetical protein n=1 Tax=Rhodoblastus sp. TaxID=1962975 RepID=UPI003F9C649C
MALSLLATETSIQTCRTPWVHIRLDGDGSQRQRVGDRVESGGGDADPDHDLPLTLSAAI